MPSVSKSDFYPYQDLSQGRNLLAHRSLDDLQDPSAPQIAEAWGKRRYEKNFVSKLTDAEGERAETIHPLVDQVQRL